MAWVKLFFGLSYLLSDSREPVLTSAQTGRCFYNSILFIQMVRAFVLGLVFLTSVKLGGLSIAVHKEHPFSVVYVCHRFLIHLLKSTAYFWAPAMPISRERMRSVSAQVCTHL